MVAGGDHTDKVRWGREQGLHVVSPIWVHESGVQLLSRGLLQHGTCCELIQLCQHQIAHASQDRAGLPQMSLHITCHCSSPATRSAAHWHD